MKLKLLLFLGSIFFVFILIEISFRNFYPISLQPWYAENYVSNFYTLKRNYSHKIDRFNFKYFATYKFGEYRNRLTSEKILNNNKILILGDSYTFGIYLKDKDTYVEKLQKDFRKFSFINSSVPGWGLQDYQLFTKFFCKEINPKKIIVIMNSNDFSRLKNINTNVVKVKKIENKFYRFLVDNFHTFSFLRKNIYLINSKLNKKKDSKIKKFPHNKFSKEKTLNIINANKKIIFEMKRGVKECNSELHFIYLGWVDYIKNENLDPTLFFLKNEINFFKTNNINFWNNNYALKNVHNDYDKFIIKHDGHPNELGSEEIYKSLKKIFIEILN